MSTKSYRPKEEEELWKTKRDPLKILADWMIDEGITDTSLLEQIGGDVRTEADAAVQFALDAPYPPVDEVDSHVYA